MRTPLTVPLLPPRPAPPGQPMPGYRSHSGDGKEQAIRDRFGSLTLRLQNNYTRIWSTSGETYIDVRGNGRA